MSHSLCEEKVIDAIDFFHLITHPLGIDNTSLGNDHVAVHFFKGLHNIDPVAIFILNPCFARLPLFKTIHVHASELDTASKIISNAALQTAKRCKHSKRWWLLRSGAFWLKLTKITNFSRFSSNYRQTFEDLVPTQAVKISIPQTKFRDVRIVKCFSSLPVGIAKCYS